MEEYGIVDEFGDISEILGNRNGFSYTEMVYYSLIAMKNNPNLSPVEALKKANTEMNLTN